MLTITPTSLVVTAVNKAYSGLYYLLIRLLSCVAVQYGVQSPVRNVRRTYVYGYAPENAPHCGDAAHGILRKQCGALAFHKWRVGPFRHRPSQEAGAHSLCLARIRNIASTYRTGSKQLLREEHPTRPWLRELNCICFSSLRPLAPLRLSISGPVKEEEERKEQRPRRIIRERTHEKERERGAVNKNGEEWEGNIDREE